MTSIIKVDTIQDSSGNNIINESSNTITVGASGDTTNVIGTLQKDGVAVANTPAFFVYKNSSQTISDVSHTKVTWTTEVFDTANAFASSKFTVPSGQAGKYFFYYQAHAYDSGEHLTQVNKSFRKNGSQVSSTDNTVDGGQMVTSNVPASIILDLAVDDYVETYVYGNTTDNNSFDVYGEGQYYTYFLGYKIIE